MKEFARQENDDMRWTGPGDGTQVCRMYVRVRTTDHSSRRAKRVMGQGQGAAPGACIRDYGGLQEAKKKGEEAMNVR